MACGKIEKICLENVIIPTILAMCPSCKKKGEFYLQGRQDCSELDMPDFLLYNCSNCNSTLAYDDLDREGLIIEIV